MADNANSQDSWSKGMSQFAEAARLNVTASRLAVTGAVALGAAATAYFLDAGRRAAFLDQTQRWTDGLTSWMGNSFQSRDAEANAGDRPATPSSS